MNSKLILWSLVFWAVYPGPLSASTQPTWYEVGCQISDDVAPLLRLNWKGDFCPPVVLVDLVQLVNDALGSGQTTLDTPIFALIQKNLTRACASLGSRVTYYVDITQGRYNPKSRYNPKNVLWTRLPSFLKYTTDLEAISLGENQFEQAEDFKCIESMHKLEIFGAENSTGEETSLIRLPKFDQTSLATLSLYGNSLLTFGQVMQALGTRASEIKSLDLSRIKCPVAELPQLARCKKLQELKLFQISGLRDTTDFSWLCDLKQLVTLRLSDCIDDTDLQEKVAANIHSVLPQVEINWS